MVEIKRKVSLKSKTVEEEPKVSSPKADINIKRKVSLKEKASGTDTTTVQTGTPKDSSNGKKPGISSGKKIILGVVALLLLACGIYALIKKDKTGQEQQIVSTITTNDNNQRQPYDEYAGQEAIEQTETDNLQEEAIEEVTPTSDDTETVQSEEDGITNTDKPQDNQLNNESTVSNPEVTESTAVSNVDNSVATQAQTTTSNIPVNSQNQSNQIVNDQDDAALWNELDQITKDVILGRYGNGQDRVDALGDSYDDVQSKVNAYYIKKYGSTKTSDVENYYKNKKR